MQATIRSSLLPQLKERSDSGGGTGRQIWLERFPPGLNRYGIPESVEI